MDQSAIQRYDASRNFSDKAFRSGCYAPFASMMFDTLGNVVACCKNWTQVLGNVSTHRLADIWHGQVIQDMRRALMDYRFEGGCEFCGWQIAGGVYNAFPHVFEDFPVESQNPEWPSMIQFSGSNTCNFECIMCNGILSSSIRAKREQLPPLPKAYPDIFFDDLRPFLPHLRMAQFFGGEPFLSHECFRIWDMMIEDGLSTRCHVATNASQYNARVERVLDALPFSIAVSLDGVTKQTVESVRVNARHEELMGNVQRFLEYTRSRGTSLHLSYCLMRQNWKEFGRFLLYADTLECPAFVNTVIEPEHCSLFTLEPEQLLRIVDLLEHEGLSVRPRLGRNRAVWDGQLAALRNNANERQSKQLATFKKAHAKSWTIDAAGKSVVVLQPV